MQPPNIFASTADIPKINKHTIHTDETNALDSFQPEHCDQLLNSAVDAFQFLGNVTVSNITPATICANSSSLLLGGVSLKFKLCNQVFNSSMTKVEISTIAAHGDGTMNWSIYTSLKYKLGQIIISERVTFSNEFPVITQNVLFENSMWNEICPEGIVTLLLSAEVNPVLHRKYEPIDANSTAFYVIVENVTGLGEVYSNEVVVRGIRWKLLTKKANSNLALYLYADKNDLEFYWGHEIKVTVTLISFNSTGSPSQAYIHNFHKRENNWGWPQFLSWSDFTSSNNKYVIDNTAIIRVDLSVGEPRLLLKNL